MSFSNGHHGHADGLFSYEDITPNESMGYVGDIALACDQFCPFKERRHENYCKRHCVRRLYEIDATTVSLTQVKQSTQCLEDRCEMDNISDVTRTINCIFLCVEEALDWDYSKVEKTS